MCNDGALYLNSSLYQYHPHISWHIQKLVAKMEGVDLNISPKQRNITQWWSSRMCILCSSSSKADVVLLFATSSTCLINLAECLFSPRSLPHLLKGYYILGLQYVLQLSSCKSISFWHYKISCSLQIFCAAFPLLLFSSRLIMIQFHWNLFVNCFGFLLC